MGLVDAKVLQIDFCWDGASNCEDLSYFRLEEAVVTSLGCHHVLIF